MARRPPGVFRRRRGGREVGGLARVLCGSLPASPSPASLAWPPPPLPSPTQSLSPTLPTPRALRSACLLFFPARSIRVADGCLWTGQQWRPLFSKEPGKVSQGPGRGAAEQRHRRWRCPGDHRHWLTEEGPRSRIPASATALPWSLGKGRPPSPWASPALKGWASCGPSGFGGV